MKGGGHSVSILRFGVAGVAVVYYIHLEFPDSVLAISCASQGCGCVSVFKVIGFEQSHYLHGKYLWKNQKG